MRWEWRTPRVDSLKFVNYAIIENAYKVRKKIFVFLCGGEMYNCWGTEQIRACVCRVINPLELSINDEARNETHIVSTGVRRY